MVPYGAPIFPKAIDLLEILVLQGLRSLDCYVAGHDRDGEVPYLTDRNGSRHLYYKREVPPELRAKGRRSQVWRSLRTSDRKKAETAYGAKHAEVEVLFAQWRKDDSEPVGSVQSQLPVKDASNFVPLTPALLRRFADAHYLNVRQWISERSGNTEPDLIGPPMSTSEGASPS